MGGVDQVSVVEAAYAIELPTEAWLKGLRARTAPMIAGPRGTLAAIYSLHQDGLSLETSAQEPEIHEFFRHAADLAPGTGIRHLVRFYHAYGSFSEAMSPLPAIYGRFWKQYRSSHFAIDDFCVLRIHDHGSGLLFVGGLYDETFQPDSRSRRFWSAMGAHLSNAFRLRRALGGKCVSPEDGEAAIGADGRVLHAIGSARHPDARARLRSAARAIDRCRTARGRCDAEGVLSAWKPIVDGKWVLLDRFDSGGRRCFIAVPVPPDARKFTRLTNKEARVIGHAARGSSNKAIAYSLGLAGSTVATHLRRGMRKLGIRERTDLPLLVARSAPTVGRIGGVDVAVRAVERATPSTTLTDAEWAVSRLAVAGFSDREIAARRRSSARTVANQLRSAFRKLGVASRHELAAELICGREVGPSPR